MLHLLVLCVSCLNLISSETDRYRKSYRSDQSGLPPPIIDLEAVNIDRDGIWENSGSWGSFADVDLRTAERLGMLQALPINKRCGEVCFDLTQHLDGDDIVDCLIFPIDLAANQQSGTPLSFVSFAKQTKPKPANSRSSQSGRGVRMPELSIGDYSLVTAVFDPNTNQVRIYIDEHPPLIGTVEESTDMAAVCLNDNPAFNLLGWDGCFNEMRVYDQAISEQQIQHIFGSSFKEFREDCSMISHGSKSRDKKYSGSYPKHPVRPERDNGMTPEPIIHLDPTDLLDDGIWENSGTLQELGDVDLAIAMGLDLITLRNVAGSRCGEVCFPLTASPLAVPNCITLPVDFDPSDGQSLSMTSFVQSTGSFSGQPGPAEVGRTRLSQGCRMPALSDDDYVMVTAVWDAEGEQVLLYIGDEIVVETTLIDIGPVNTLCLNDNPAFNGLGWDGCLNEIRVFDEAMSSQQIRYLFDSAFRSFREECSTKSTKYRNHGRSGSVYDLK